MFHLFLVFFIALAGTSCANLGVKTQGTNGPIAWQAVDLKINSAGPDAGFQDDRNVYSFTLVLTETEGRWITFTKLEYAVSYDGSPAMSPLSQEKTGRWVLKPNGELRSPFSSTYVCLDTNCETPTSQSPSWHIILSGTDSKSIPVRAEITLKLPADPMNRS